MINALGSWLIVKSQCNLAQPSCSQCRRAGRICSGYRDTNTLAFRDQSNQTASKFRKVLINDKEQSHAGILPKEQGQNRDSGSTDGSGALIPARDTIALTTKTLAPSPYDQAVAYFISNYVLQDSGSKMSYFDYLPQAIGRTDSISPLLSVVKSIGLAGIGHTQHDPQVQLVSTREYSAAISGINTALQDPTRAKKDETLMTVFLLALYEVCDAFWLV